MNRVTQRLSHLDIRSRRLKLERLERRCLLSANGLSPDVSDDGDNERSRRHDHQSDTRDVRAVDRIQESRDGQRDHHGSRLRRGRDRFTHRRDSLFEPATQRNERPSSSTPLVFFADHASTTPVAPLGFEMQQTLTTFQQRAVTAASDFSAHASSNVSLELAPEPTTTYPQSFSSSVTRDLNHSFIPIDTDANTKTQVSAEQTTQAVETNVDPRPPGTETQVPEVHNIIATELVSARVVDAASLTAGSTTGTERTVFSFTVDQDVLLRFDLSEWADEFRRLRDNDDSLDQTIHDLAAEQVALSAAEHGPESSSIAHRVQVNNSSTARHGFDHSASKDTGWIEGLDSMILLLPSPHQIAEIASPTLGIEPLANDITGWRSGVGFYRAFNFTETVANPEPASATVSLDDMTIESSNWNPQSGAQVVTDGSDTGAAEPLVATQLDASISIGLAIGVLGIQYLVTKNRPQTKRTIEFTTKA